MGSVKRDIRLKEVEIGMKFGQLTLIEKYTKKGTKQKYTYFQAQECNQGFRYYLFSSSNLLLRQWGPLFSDGQSILKG